MASSTVYPTAGGSGVETDYGYLWYTGTVQVQQETTTLPIVSAAQNGPGGTTPWTTKQVFAFGSLIWEEDADGGLTYHQYDPVTGLIVKTVEDVSADPRPANSGLPDPPDGFPSAGVNAGTDYQHDPLGRLTETLGPEYVDATGDTVRTASWTSYVNAPVSFSDGQGEGGQGTEVRTVGGFEVDTPAIGSQYSAGQFVRVNPVTIAVSNLDGQATDQIQAEDGSGLTVVEASSRNILCRIGKPPRLTSPLIDSLVLSEPSRHLRDTFASALDSALDRRFPQGGNRLTFFARRVGRGRSGYR